MQCLQVSQEMHMARICDLFVAETLFLAVRVTAATSFVLHLGGRERLNVFELELH